MSKLFLLYKRMGILLSLLCLLCLFSLLSLLLLCSGCRHTQSGNGTLTVSAAASLQNALNDIYKAYRLENPHLKITFNYGGSGTLQQQIEQGAPVDLFISAAPDHMNTLADKNLINTASRSDLLTNSLVLIVPSSTAAAGPKTLDDLNSGAVKKIAVGTPESVPAGKYARQTLTHAGLWDGLQPKLVLTKDVSQALTYVSSGNVDAGFVYASDAKNSDKVSIVLTVPADSHDAILYPAAILSGSRNPEGAQAFLDYLQTEEARRIFSSYGFQPAENH
jgi:molybdate transport system substrate-binding protein